MKLARVIGPVVSTAKLPAYEARKLLLVQPLAPDGSQTGTATMAIDYVGAGEGDVVLMGSAPGLAELVFRLERAPINEMLMGVVDDVVVQGTASVAAGKVPSKG